MTDLTLGQNLFGIAVLAATALSIGLPIMQTYYQDKLDREKAEAKAKAEATITKLTPVSAVPASVVERASIKEAHPIPANAETEYRKEAA